MAVTKRPVKETVGFERELEQELERARTLLRDHEDDLPAGVVGTVGFFVQNSLWFQLSRNPKVLSCRDAASRRYRLGYRGIPLSDELRSYLAESHDDTGCRTYVLLHCRGDASIDFSSVERVHTLSQLNLQRADLREFDADTIGYGLINPFIAPVLLASKGRVIQVFDPSVSDGSGETKTMTTNAGDKTWAVEFDPTQLLSGNRDGFALVERIVSRTYQRSSEQTKVIGLLTGNAPASGALLWKKINGVVSDQRGSAFRGDVSYPRVIVHSLPAMGWSMELGTRHSKLRPEILNEVQMMAEDGAEIVALACNTTQYFADEIEDKLRPFGAKFVRLADAVKDWIESIHNEKIFVVGIGYVTGEDGWSAFPFLRSTSTVLLPDMKQAELIEGLAYEVKTSGVSHKAYQKLRSIVRMSHAKYVLLLLTELSMIFEKYPRPNIGEALIVDSMDLYAQRIAQLAAAARAGIS